MLFIDKDTTKGEQQKDIGKGAEWEIINTNDTRDKEGKRGNNNDQDESNSYV